MCLPQREYGSLVLGRLQGGQSDIMNQCHSQDNYVKCYPGAVTPVGLVIDVPTLPSLQQGSSHNRHGKRRLRESFLTNMAEYVGKHVRVPQSA